MEVAQIVVALVLNGGTRVVGERLKEKGLSFIEALFPAEKIAQIEPGPGVIRGQSEGSAISRISASRGRLSAS